MINLLKLNTIKIDLNVFLKNVYNIDIEELNEWEHYSFEHCLTDSDIEKEHIEYCIKKYNLDGETAKSLLTTIMIYKYEESYMTEYYENYISQLEQKIITDFKNIYKVNSDQFPFNEIKIKNVDFEKNIIELITSIEDIVNMLLDSINNYGLFEITSMSDFFNMNAAFTQKEKEKEKVIVNHLHWLNNYEEINGTIFNIFKFDSKFVDYYGTLGTYKIEIADIDEHIKNYGY
jgi:hypothetical protein